MCMLGVLYSSIGNLVNNCGCNITRTFTGIHSTVCMCHALQHEVQNSGCVLECSDTPTSHCNYNNLIPTSLPIRFLLKLLSANSSIEGPLPQYPMPVYITKGRI